MWSGRAVGALFFVVDGGWRVPVCSGLRRGLLLGCRNSAKTVFKKSELAACCRSDSGLLKNNADSRRPRISSPPAEAEPSSAALMAHPTPGNPLNPPALINPHFRQSPHTPTTTFRPEPNSRGDGCRFATTLQEGS